MQGAQCWQMDWAVHTWLGISQQALFVMPYGLVGTLHFFLSPLSLPSRATLSPYPSAKINISYYILFNLTTSYSSYFGGKKGISRNKTSFFLLMSSICFRTLLTPSLTYHHILDHCYTSLIYGCSLDTLWLPRSHWTDPDLPLLFHYFPWLSMTHT